MSVAMSRPHSGIGDPMMLLPGASLSAEVLLIRPKPIRPTASESDAARSSNERAKTDAQSPQHEQRTAAAATASGTSRGRPLGAFTLVMPAAATSVYERELCSLFRRTALANDPTAQHDPRATIAISRIRRSRTPNQPNGASTTNQNAGAHRRPCSACYHEALSPAAVTAALATVSCQSNDVQMQTQRCPLSDLLPLVRARGARQNTFPPVHQVQDVRHYSEPLIATNLFPVSSCTSAAIVSNVDHSSGTRKRRRKETDENASDLHGTDATHYDWADSPLPESGDDEAIDPEVSASPTRADSKCRRRIVASTVRPSINAEKMLTASSSEVVPNCRPELPRNDEQRADLSKRASETYCGSPSSTRNNALYCERLATMHASFSVADSLLASAFVHTASVSTGDSRPTPNSDEVERALRTVANSSATPTHSGNTKSNCESNPEEAQSDDYDACSSLSKSTELASFAPHGTAQFRIISELDIDQIENN